MKKPATILAAAALTMVGAAAMAQQSTPAGPGGGPGMGQGMGRGMGRGMGAGRMIALRDIDKNGFVTRAEHRSWAAQVFAAMDANGDGKLSRVEYMSVRMGPRGYRQGTGWRHAEMQKRMQARKQARFAAMDPDRDGFVTRAQFMAQADRNFAAMDANHDGKVGMGEFQGWYRGM
jgi:Ca2+-binding EF-hand superfamily protein